MSKSSIKNQNWYLEFLRCVAKLVVGSCIGDENGAEDLLPHLLDEQLKLGVRDDREVGQVKALVLGELADDIKALDVLELVVDDGALRVGLIEKKMNFEWPWCNGSSACLGCKPFQVPFPQTHAYFSSLA